jgi:hypothetical protein
MVDMRHLKCREQTLVWVRLPSLVRVTIRKNGGTDAKYEMETFETRIKEWMRYKPHSRYIIFFGGVAQLARASALHAEGHRFDSCHLHQKKTNSYGK